MFRREDVEFTPIQALTPEVYAKIKIGVRFEDLYALGLKGEIEFVSGSSTMPDMWYKFNELTGEFDAYTHYAAMMKYLAGMNIPDPTESEVPGAPIATINDLISAVSTGGEFKLTSSFDLPQAAVVTADTTIHLNGQSILGGLFQESGGSTSEGNTDSYGFWVKDGGNLTIDGDGIVEAQECQYSMAIWAQNGNVTINGGTFINGGDACDLIYASGNSLVEIYGGIFKPTARTSELVPGTMNAYTALNVKDADYRAGTANIVVYGGKFYGFDPANNVSEGANTNFVAEGYESIESEEGGMKVYTVQKIAE